jgi:2-isopropylmalate synthase
MHAMSTTHQSAESSSNGDAPHVADLPGVRIFDTTLRDGEQAPGCTMTRAEKLDVARQLARLGVDIIEAGFPVSSPAEWDAVAAVADAVGTRDGPVICGLARATAGDIERCATAIRAAAHRRIHTFIATSELHLEYKLRMTHAQVLGRVDEAVRLARTYTDDVEFSPEDATRSDPTFLDEVLHVAIDAGATTLNIPDTVGYATPEEYAALIRRACAVACRAPRVVVSTHCHDDLGLAVANSLAGVRAGARQVECTINGIGERAGNASLEEVVMALQTRRHFFGVATRIRSHELVRTSRLVSRCTGVFIPPNKAIVGANAFAHESGIHQDGMLKHPATYEIMTPESVGVDGTQLILGKHSGRAALRQRLEHLGFDLSDDAFLDVFERFKALTERKKTVDDREIESLVGSEYGPPPVYDLVQAQVSCGTHAIPTASVSLRTADGRTLVASATGDGPVDAVCRAINSVIGDVGELSSFTVRAVTEGVDALGEATVRLADHRSARLFVGRASHTDIIAAAAEAYLAAVNLLLYDRSRPARVSTPANTIALEAV